MKIEEALRGYNVPKCFLIEFVEELIANAVVHFLYTAIIICRNLSVKMCFVVFLGEKFRDFK